MRILSICLVWRSSIAGLGVTLHLHGIRMVDDRMWVVRVRGADILKNQNGIKTMDTSILK